MSGILGVVGPAGVSARSVLPARTGAVARRRPGRDPLGGFAVAIWAAGARLDHAGVDPATGSGWSITAPGPAEPLSNPDEAAHHRRTLPGWAHGPHDSLPVIRPQTVHGYRLAGGPVDARPRVGGTRTGRAR